MPFIKFVWVGDIIQATIDEIITDEPVVTAKQIEYGCTCTECNELYPHAEVRDNFVCYSCKSYKSMFQ